MSQAVQSTSPCAPTESDWVAIGAVTLGVTAFAMAQGLTYPLISLVLTARGVDEAIIGLNSASYMLGLAVSTIVMPKLTRFLPPGPLVVASLALSAASLFALSQLDSLAAWFILRFALGFGVNTIYVIGEAWINVAAVDRVRGRAAGLYGAGMAAGFAIGPLGIPLFGVEQGLSLAVCAVLTAGVAFMFALMNRFIRVQPTAMPAGALIPFIRRNPILFIAVLLYGVIDASVLGILPVYLYAEGMAEDHAALVVTAAHVGMIASQGAVGWALDRFNRWSVAAACFSLSAVSFVLLVATPVSSFLIWAVVAGAGGAFFGLYTSCVAILGGAYRGGALVAGSAAFAMAYAAGGALGTPLTGAAMSVSPAAAPAVLSLISGIGALAILLRRR
ncbi:MAG: MFS transporter [Alphaproteobacteria bacterium]|nr:MFS transporter [Alphaproteobacteria bacterium]